jgi:hypothetical protein
VTFRAYLWKWFLGLFPRPYAIAQGILGFFAAVGPIVADAWPRFDNEFNVLAWKAAVGAFLLLIVIRFFRYPYETHVKNTTRIAELERDHRAVLTFDRLEAETHEGNNYVRQDFFISVVNAGLSSLENVSVEIVSTTPPPIPNWLPAKLQLKNDDAQSHVESKSFTLRAREARPVGLVQYNLTPHVNIEEFRFYDILRNVDTTVHVGMRRQMTIVARADNTAPVQCDIEMAFDENSRRYSCRVTDIGAFALEA